MRLSKSAEAEEVSGSFCRLAKCPAKRRPAARKKTVINLAGVFISPLGRKESEMKGQIGSLQTRYPGFKAEF
jgi:hypothetical protein